MYVTNVFIDTVTAYAIGPNGTLSSIGSFATGSLPFGLVVDPTASLSMLQIRQVTASRAITSVPRVG